MQRLRQIAGDKGWISYEDFIGAALYDPELGYYQRNRRRVGRDPQADFYTASSIGNLFAPLIIEACVKLLGDNPKNFTFVEIGAEPESGLLHNHEHPFADYRTIGAGEKIELNGNLVVFSNELFDAQPFRRLLYRDGRWQERILRISEDSENLVEDTIDPSHKPLPKLPDAGEGYQLDWPQAAAELCRQIAGQPWQGLWVCLDYGLSEAVLLQERPQGTARTYAQHRMGDDLLANPGETDITCHICWDHLETILDQSGFNFIDLKTQESFFMHHSTHYISRILQDSQGQFSRERQSLKELLHPQHMGRRFQALSARRMPEATSAE